MSASNYVTRVLNTATAIAADAWDALLALEPNPSPFMRHAYLAAMETSGAAVAETGWQAQFVTLWQNDVLVAACPMYLKRHSYGEYVFDWAWANAYEQHGLGYYPKALVAVPFTPVPGARLLARTPADRTALVHALIEHVRAEHLSSLHLLFVQPQDVAAVSEAGLMLRHTVQFHWKNVAPMLPAARGSLPPEGADLALGRPGGESVAPTLPTAQDSLPPEGADPALGRPGGGAATAARPVQQFIDFDQFLASLQQEKRKKIRQERRKVAQAGVVFRWSRGRDITAEDWAFFYRCYERTYLEHGNAPYLSPVFFQRMAEDMPEQWLLFIAEREGHPIASSLIGIDDEHGVAYGRYWGAIERVDCLHFEACYYQPLDWCIAHGFQRFEGGAQGEHKMARALLPVKTTSAHWLAHPSFANAVERFLQREGEGIGQYLDHLGHRSPLRKNQDSRALDFPDGEA